MLVVSAAHPAYFPYGPICRLLRARAILMTSTDINASGLDGIAVLIPAWEPDEALLDLTHGLRAAGFGVVLVVDDGSGPGSLALFQSLETHGVRVLRHAVNLGKGRALKTGFNCLLKDYPTLRAVVTVDADGQHTPNDTVRVAQTWLAGDGRPVLGARTFGRDVPLRSQLGNQATRLVFGLISGTRLHDTQTGLRALPFALLPQLITLEGERYEFEMTVLAFLCREGQHPIELPIETVYLDGNRSSHFNPVRDSMRIYFVLLRFYFSSLVAAGVDFFGFTVTFTLTRNLLLSFAVGRLSSLVNFAINRGWVFRSRGSVAATLWRYYALALGIALLSYGSLWLLVTQHGWNVFAAKITADTLLSLVSFSMQRTFIFRRRADVDSAA